AAVVPVQVGPQEHGGRLFHAGVVQGDLLGPVGTDIVAGGGGGALLAGGAVRSGQHHSTGSGVEGHIHTHGLTDGPDGNVGGAVVQEHGTTYVPVRAISE